MLNEQLRVENDLLKNDHHANTTIMYHNLEEDDIKHFHCNDDNSF